MDAIEVEELKHPEPHDTSFCPKPAVPAVPIPNGSAVSPESPKSALGSRTNSNFSLSLLRRNNTSELEAATRKLLREEADNDSQHGKGFLPCHYFDYIAGTSTGGLNAIMLGRLRMPVEECLARYPDMAQNIFSGKKKSFVSRLMQGTSSKYDSQALEAEIRKIVSIKAPMNVAPLQQDFQFDEFHLPLDLCKT